MSSLTTLARPYAKAAFELALADGALAQWDDLLASTAAVTADAGMARWLKSPHYDAGKAVAIVLEALGGEVDARFQGYLEVLADNDRLALLGEVHRLYGQLRQQAEKRVEVRVVSAVALDDSQAGRMREALAKRLDCEISLHNDVDASVLGGAVIYAGSKVIDGSLKGRLERLRSSLS